MPSSEGDLPLKYLAEVTLREAVRPLDSSLSPIAFPHQGAKLPACPFDDLVSLFDQPSVHKLTILDLGLQRVLFQDLC